MSRIHCDNEIVTDPQLLHAATERARDPEPRTSKITFHPYGNWSAVSLNGNCVGYIMKKGDTLHLHAHPNAPLWLKHLDGKWDSMKVCQEAIKAAASRITA